MCSDKVIKEYTRANGYLAKNFLGAWAFGIFLGIYAAINSEPDSSTPLWLVLAFFFCVFWAVGTVGYSILFVRCESCNKKLRPKRNMCGRLVAECNFCNTIWVLPVSHVSE
jgi:hypothetical protein